MDMKIMLQPNTYNLSIISSFKSLITTLSSFVSQIATCLSSRFYCLCKPIITWIQAAVAWQCFQLEMKYWICLKFMFYFHLKWALTFKTISHSYMRCDNTIRLRKKKEKLVLLTIIVLHTSLTHVWCPASFDKNLKAYKNMAWALGTDFE